MPVATVNELDIAFADTGPEAGPAVLLLHGWPDDPSTWDGVATHLIVAGFRIIVPALRGFGETRFRSETAPRTGDPGILALDAIGLMDALEIRRFSVIGHDWGSSIAEALAVGWPERVERIAMLSTTPRLGGLKTTGFHQAQLDWYQWFLATARGAEAIRDDRRGFAHLNWLNWGPSGWFNDATFAAVSRAWDNDDWLEVTLHSYRSRWGEVALDERGAWLVNKVSETKTLALPVLIIQGKDDGVSPPEEIENSAESFKGQFNLILLPGVGHFPQREAPDAVAAHLLSFLGVRSNSG